MLEDKPIVVAKETTLFFPMLKDEPTTAAALSEPSLAATPKNTPNVHVSSPIKLLIRATILESEPEIATERVLFQILVRKLIFQDALNDPKWKEAILKKMRALKKNQTWEVVNLPKGKMIVGYK
ncbi:hypothetical protein CK203_075373 [Vitis vinifera]|uniref:Reverse transcriptase Ty1/copia-type domain-containing protein n=1 Tax=Vitis vinifera TaxID=29760 RepID=A0A438BXD7_VITVI|nr:hypothetical protein CK203_075373 [Vitis vinifera]